MPNGEDFIYFLKLFPDIFIDQKEYPKGSSAEDRDSYYPLERVGEDEILVGPYNISCFLLEYLSNERMEASDARKRTARKCLGAVLRRRRKELEMTQEELVDEVENVSEEKSLSRKTIFRTEKGETLLNRHTLKAICDALELNYFFCLQRTSRLYWESYDGESFPSIKEEYDLED
ncbi:helix-turn-helix transcriptional regulator [Candidatus Bipolaricaulota bacterium]|nr:helix-turn-helix transcriptional regulator [Candidatus Bipolaricaulota bacterium]